MQLYLGVSGNREGPYSLEAVQQKVREGSVSPDVLVWHEGLSGWTDLRTFLAAQGAAVPASATPVGRPPPPPTPQPARTSGMAIASLVLGITGFCGVTAVLGLIFGIIGLLKINRSHGRLTGGGLAIAGICLSAFMLLVSIPLLAGLTLPALAKAKARAQRIACISNIKQINLGLLLYADQNAEVLPAATGWCDAILPHVGSPRVFICPGHRGAVRCSYALNEAAAGQPLSQLRANMILVFESDGGWNASGGLETMTSRHYNGCNVGLADGSAHQVTEAAIERMDWGGGAPALQTFE